MAKTFKVIGMAGMGAIGLRCPVERPDAKPFFEVEECRPANVMIIRRVIITDGDIWFTRVTDRMYTQPKPLIQDKDEIINAIKKFSEELMNG
jgi:hypothetical protein